MEQAVVTTLPISPGSFWTIVIFTIILVCACILVALWRSDTPPKDGWRAFLDRLGVAQFPNYLAAPFVVIWCVIFTILLLGLIWTILLIFTGGPVEPDATERRWLLLSFTALVATLGAVVALPFTLIKTRQNERQTTATEEGLITDRINKAVEGLGAEKKIDRIGRPVSLLDSGGDDETLIQWQGEALPKGDVLKKGDWQVFSESLPNLEVRIGSILALERLARNNLDIHVQIMQILCAYIRHNAPASKAIQVPDFVEPTAKPSKGRSMRKIWEDTTSSYSVDLRKALKTVKPREDIQVALTVLGRRSAEGRRREAGYLSPDLDRDFPFDSPGPKVRTRNDTGSIDAEELQHWKSACDAYRGYRLDLRGGDLQGADLIGLNFGGARFEKALMQGADLWEALMQGADLREALMQGADLWGAQMQGADLDGAKMNSATNITRTNLRHVSVVSVDFTAVPQIAPHLPELFGDGSTRLPEGVERPAHWPVQELDWEEFQEEWEKWRGDPAGYAPPPAPEEA